MRFIGFPELLVILGVFSLLYFLPTWFGWKTRDRWPVFWLNLLLGWTAIGWIAAMVLAVRARDHIRA